METYVRNLEKERPGIDLDVLNEEVVRIGRSHLYDGKLKRDSFFESLNDCLF